VELSHRGQTYWIALGLFIALFGGSIIFGLVDVQASVDEFQHLGFPAWSFYFLTAGKFFGLVAVVTRRSEVLAHFAFAGFLFDLLLALSAHLAQPEIKFLLPLFSLAIWGFAFWADQRVVRRAPELIAATA
jgi:hypothetical protein